MWPWLWTQPTNRHCGPSLQFGSGWPGNPRSELCQTPCFHTPLLIFSSPAAAMDIWPSSHGPCTNLRTCLTSHNLSANVILIYSHTTRPNNWKTDSIGLFIASGRSIPYIMHLGNWGPVSQESGVGQGRSRGAAEGQCIGNSRGQAKNTERKNTATSFLTQYRHTGRGLEGSQVGECPPWQRIK